MSNVDWDGLETVFEASKGVEAAWVFGSAREGEVRDGSDLEIGILFEERPPLMGLADLRARLQMKLKIDEIDLVVLNDPSSITRFEVISRRPVLCRNRQRWAEFASLTARGYEDEMAFLEWGLSLGAGSEGLHVAEGE